MIPSIDSLSNELWDEWLDLIVDGKYLNIECDDYDERYNMIDQLFAEWMGWA